ncbi:butyrophilin subfamily 1 member A1-like isoform 2-T8 [Pholidichthys leucotaenia]
MEAETSQLYLSPGQRWSSSPGEVSAHVQSKLVQAVVGGDVILPCSFDTSPSSDVPDVEWSKEGIKPNVVLLYRDGCETYEMKNPSYQYRTSLIMNKLKDGNTSLRISNVQKSDEGKYRCMMLSTKNVTTVELSVVAVPEPELRVNSTKSGQVMLQCEVSCCWTEPWLTLLDDQRNEIPAGDQRHSSKNATGCFTARVTLQSAPRRVTCRVHLPEFNQTRDTKILIPFIHELQHQRHISDCHGSFVSTTATIPVTIGGILVVIAFLWHKKCSRHEFEKQQVIREESDESTTREDQNLLDQRTNTVCIDNSVNSYAELERIADKLQSELKAHVK